MGSNSYGGGVDVFAAGLVVMEILTGVPLVPGDTEVAQLQLLMRVLGGADADETSAVPRDIATWVETQETTDKGLAAKSSAPVIRRRRHLMEKVLLQKPDFAAVTCAQLDPQHAAFTSSIIASFVDLVARMLAFDPEARITAEQARDHVFFAQSRAVGWI
jgi:serine/threonine protein kinase